VLFGIVEGKVLGHELLFGNFTSQEKQFTPAPALFEFPDRFDALEFFRDGTARRVRAREYGKPLLPAAERHFPRNIIETIERGGLDVEACFAEPVGGESDRFPVSRRPGPPVRFDGTQCLEVIPGPGNEYFFVQFSLLDID
jgi:hypothetical protein